MICTTCFGTHVLTINHRPTPCPDCQGLGALNCCDGLNCCADSDAATDDEPGAIEQDIAEVYFAS